MHPGARRQYTRGSMWYAARCGIARPRAIRQHRVEHPTCGLTNYIFVAILSMRLENIKCKRGAQLITWFASHFELVAMSYLQNLVVYLQDFVFIQVHQSELYI